MCETDSVEDETHFLINCDFYRNIRLEIFVEQLNDANFSQLSDHHKMGYLMNNHPRKCAKFIVKGYRMRRSAMYRN